MNNFLDQFGIISFCCFVAGLFLGFILGVWVSDEVTRSMNSQADLETACIEGNANACRVYEVRYGRPD